MLSKNQIKHVTALHQKKFRKELGLFIAEGEKVVSDLLKSDIPVRQIFSMSEFLPELDAYLTQHPQAEVLEVKRDELERISAQETPQSVLAVAEIPAYSTENIPVKGELTLVLDEIQDPGNVGAMLRIADWFGIKHIICSQGTADAYHPKVVQSSMGSLFRVKAVQMSLNDLFEKNKQGAMLPVYGTFMEGENIFTTDLSADGILVFGNESAGIHRNWWPSVTKRLTIPSFQSIGNNVPDSLNVSVAAGIICAEFRRRSLFKS